VLESIESCYSGHEDSFFSLHPLVRDSLTERVGCSTHSLVPSLHFIVFFLHMEVIYLMKNCAFVSAFLWIKFHASAAPPAANVVQRHRGWTPRMLHLSAMIRRTFSIWVPGKHLCRLCLPPTSRRAHQTKHHCWAGLATPSITSGAQARSSPAGTAALRPWLPLLSSHHSSR
jgi:hypothetical protein